MGFKITKTDGTTEKKIATGLIVSTEYLREISEIIDLSYIQNTYAKKICAWCLKFFDDYGEAPFLHIGDLFDIHKSDLDDNEIQIIDALLSDISEKYIQTNINAPFLLDRTITYFKQRELEIIHGNIGVLLERGDILAAEDEITNFHKVSRITSEWINPFDEKYLDLVYNEGKQDFFKFRGDLGRFIGNLEREWFVGITGPFKRGKTWSLQEFAVSGVMQGLKVAMFSLEMPAKKMLERGWMRLAGVGPSENGNYIFPCFDCVSNQNGDCGSPNRASSISLYNEEGDKPSEYDAGSIYQPCTYCRTNNRELFLPNYWYEEIEKPANTLSFMFRQILALRKQFPHSLRFKIYPRFSANLDNINRDLDILEKAEAFIPDMIIIDYADILKAESGTSSTGVDTIDATWKSLAKLGGERHALIVTAAQASKDALEAEQVKQKHTSLWIGKLAHVDVMLALNQTEKEKQDGVMRYSKMVHRHEDFSESENCYVLQNLIFGQANLDSQIRRAI